MQRTRLKQSQRLVKLGVFVLAGVIVALLGVWYVSPDSPVERTEFVKLCAQSIGGVLLAVGLYYTAKNFQLNREGQITERFTRAIDQLGSETDAICLGGIFALERIARDSPADRDHIYNILASFLKIRSLRPATSQAEEEFIAENENPDDDYAVPYVPGGEGPSTVAQAVVSVLGRRTTYDSSVDLRELNLRSINLRDVDFTGLTFDRVSFSYADFRGALFSDTTMNYCNLEHARFESTDISNLRLTDTILKSTNFYRAKCDFGDLSKCIFEGCDMRDAAFSSSNLRWTRFVTCMLHESDLSGSDLSDSKFINSSLYMTDLGNANLNRCSFRTTELRQVRGLTRSQIAAADIGKGTTLPGYLASEIPAVDLLDNQ